MVTKAAQPGYAYVFVGTSYSSPFIVEGRLTLEGTRNEVLALREGKWDWAQDILFMFITLEVPSYGFLFLA